MKKKLTAGRSACLFNFVSHADDSQDGGCVSSAKLVATLNLLQQVGNILSKKHTPCVEFLKALRIN